MESRREAGSALAPLRADSEGWSSRHRNPALRPITPFYLHDMETDRFDPRRTRSPPPASGAALDRPRPRPGLRVGHAAVRTDPVAGSLAGTTANRPALRAPGGRSSAGRRAGAGAAGAGFAGTVQNRGPAQLPFRGSAGSGRGDDLHQGQHRLFRARHLAGCPTEGDRGLSPSGAGGRLDRGATRATARFSRSLAGFFARSLLVSRRARRNRAFWAARRASRQHDPTSAGGFLRLGDGLQTAARSSSWPDR